MNQTRGHHSFDHTADVGIEAWAPTLPALLEEVTLGLCELIADTSCIVPREERPVVLRADDREELLVSFANEVIFLLDTEAFLVGAVEVAAISNDDGQLALHGTLRGEPLDRARHLTFTEIKSATYHDLSIQEEAGALRVRVVFDV